MANPQIVPHSQAASNPINIKQITEDIPVKKNAPKVKMSPINATLIKALPCDKYLGIKMVLDKYPTSMAYKVYSAKCLACSNGIPKDLL